MVDLYRRHYPGWNVRHLHSFYRRDHGGRRSYTWVKLRLQEAGAVAKAKARGKHRRRRERAPLPGMLLHQDGSRHEWVPGKWWDLIVTMDDATGEHYSMFFCQEEGTECQWFFNFPHPRQLKFPHPVGNCCRRETLPGLP